MNSESIDTIIVGSLNTDLIVNGAQRLVGQGESTIAKGFNISAGGKSRNLAAMIATLKGTGKNIAFIGKTLKDQLGLWEYPYQSLIDLDIDVSSIQIVQNHPYYKFPGLAIIPTDQTGQNQIYLVPEIREDFHKEDILKSEELFKDVGDKSGALGITLEMPLDAAIESMQLARKYNIRSFVDPGGIEGRPELIEALSLGGFLIKPNEHEARAITGQAVTDFDSARKAAAKILRMGYQYTVITHGANGAYLFGEGIAKHIPVPSLNMKTGNSVGCGDQTMAGIIYGLSIGKSIEDSVQTGVVAGTLQYAKDGIVPVSLEELNSYI